MATTVTKVFRDEHIEITGELDENLPILWDGLVAHYEFDGSTNGIQPDQNILDDSVWVAGTSGSVGNWSMVGTTAENTRINKTNPFGATDVVWASEGNDVTSDADGGWQNSGRSIDKTKTYRLSLWVRRENIGNGRVYFGCQHSTVWNLGTTTVNTNPYFITAIETEIPGEMEDNWLLWVAHIHPTAYAGSTHIDTGIWTMSGRKLNRSATDFKWTSTTTVSGHRAFLHYSTSTTEREYQYDPRMEIVDDYSSTIGDMLKQQYNIIHPITDANTLLNTYGFGSQGGYHTTTNVTLNPTGNSGAGVPGSYTPGWDVTLHPLAFNVSNWGGGYNGGVGSPTIGYHAQWVNEGTDGSACMKFIDRNDLFGLSHRWLGISEQVSGNVDTSWNLVSQLKTLTMSWDQKVDDLGKYSNVGFYHKENSSSTFGTSKSNHYNTVINQWERMTKTYTVTGAWDAGTWMNLYFYGHNGSYATLWIDNVQLEIDRDYSTAFVNGGGTTSLLTLPNPVKTGEFTVNFWCKILPSVLTVGAYHTIFSMGNYYTNNSFTIMDNDGTDMRGDQKLIRRGNVGEWAWADGSFTNSGNYQEWNMYTIVRGSTDYDCYLNGVFVGDISHLSTTMQDNIYISSRESSGSLCPSYIKKLSFYDRAIPLDELDNLYGIGSMKINGDFVVGYANELNPNIYPNADLSTTTYPSQGNGTVTLEQDEDGRYHQLILNNTTSTWRGFIIDDGPRIGLTYHEGIEVGETYIFSGYFWRSTGSSPQYYTVRAEGTAGGTILGPTWSSIPESEWTYCSLEFVADDSQNCLVYPSGGTTGATGTFRWRNLSVIKKIGKPLTLNSTRDLYTGNILEG